MKLIEPEIYLFDNLKKVKRDVNKKLERIGRVAYKSENRINGYSYKKFLKKIMSANPPHTSVLQHVQISVLVVTDRGISHEIVRHRIGAYLQESTRYCNYSKEKFEKSLRYMNIINKEIFKDNPEAIKIFLDALKYSEESYLELIELGVSPQYARSVLPHALKTEIVITFNLDSWRNFFIKRAEKTAHPDIQIIANNLLYHFKKYLPEIFGDLTYSNDTLFYKGPIINIKQLKY